MPNFQETVDVSTTSDGFVAVDVHRAYANGIEYRSVLYFQPADAAKLADAVERFARTRLDDTIALADGTVRLFAQDRSAMINVELTRDAALPRGGYDTLDVSPATAPALVAGLRRHAP